MSERAAYWGELLAEWEGSGLSQAEFCRRRGVKAVTLAWWKRRLRGTDEACGRRGRSTARGAGRTGFVEVALPSESGFASSPHGAAAVSSGHGYAIVLPGGACLRLPGDFDPERVARLVQAVAAAC
jgi:hypothetical protein